MAALGRALDLGDGLGATLDAGIDATRSHNSRV